MRIVHTPDAPQQPEPSFSEDYDSQPEQNWNPMGNRTASDEIIGGIVDSFFK